MFHYSSSYEAYSFSKILGDLGPLLLSSSISSSSSSLVQKAIGPFNWSSSGPSLGIDESSKKVKLYGGIKYVISLTSCPPYVSL